MKIAFKKLFPDAQTPERKSAGAAGYDLTYYGKDIVLCPGARWSFQTGIAVAIPQGCYGRIASRSGLAREKGIAVLGGVIDSDYRGEIQVLLLNTSDFRKCTILPGDRIAQLIIETCHEAEFVEFDSLEETERGANGFGSTDQK